jgi:DNA-binding MarR family transcriptional regulator
MEAEAKSRPGECSGLPDADPVAFDQLDAAQRGQLLVAQTVRFTAAFARWTEGQACGGLTYPRLRLLQALHCGGPAIMRDLGTQLGVSPRNMTAIVDALEEAKLVTRQPHPKDRRATVVQLSPDGAKAANQALEPQLNAMAELFQALSVEEQQQLSLTLTRLIDAVDSKAASC